MFKPFIWHLETFQRAQLYQCSCRRRHQSADKGARMSRTAHQWHDLHQRGTSALLIMISRVTGQFWSRPCIILKPYGVWVPERQNNRPSFNWVHAQLKSARQHGLLMKQRLNLTWATSDFTSILIANGVLWQYWHRHPHVCLTPIFLIIFKTIGVWHCIEYF